MARALPEMEEHVHLAGLPVLWFPDECRARLNIFLQWTTSISSSWSENAFALFKTKLLAIDTDAHFIESCAVR